ncbi:hypothetical protein LEP1GSC047_3216 [Leptospira inadai serovar Lyme str. 10]|uniref:Uncharacterized protein n=1 Tax=Leptospira inadai serovar Lyme str. 10 TaxID=1049790 RepID=V6HBJ1_9LEPT|nr:hypothetical protein LEP1GSC047_3216 [Leptospira inadai serovar Lyme str. 10]
MILYRTFVLFYHLRPINTVTEKRKLKWNPTDRSADNIRFTRFPRT